MTVIPLTQKQPQSGIALFALGFRPFFLLAGLSAITLMSLWLLMLNGKLLAPAYYPGHFWHSHEMLFGYTTAVIVGFLLTASRNWTGIQTLSGRWLAALCLVWLGGRLMPFLSSSPIVIGLTDLAFLLFAGIAIGCPVIRAKQYNNLLFTPIIFGLWIANLLMHLQLLDITSNTLLTGQRLAVALIVMLIVIMGSRVVPFFIARGTGNSITREWPKIRLAGDIVIFCWMVSFTLLGDHLVSGWLALAASILLFIRLAGWHISTMWKNPMLWILFISALWLPVGMVMQFLTTLGWISSTFAIHAFTAGAIGGLTLGMMSRVILGHTGREISSGKLTLIIFFCALFVPIARLLPALPGLPADYNFWLQLSGGMWISAFTLFTIQYSGMLLKPRIDGQPG